MWRWLALVVVLFSAGCGDDSEDDSEPGPPCSECDAIAAEIEAQALADPRLGSSQGVCVLPWGEAEPYIPDPGFKEACAKYSECRDTCE